MSETDDWRSILPHQKGGSGQDLPEATEAEKAWLRENLDEAILTTKGSSNHRRFHIPTRSEGTETYCAYFGKLSQADNRARRPLSAYPEGWHEWCRYCLKEWRKVYDIE